MRGHLHVVQPEEVQYSHRAFSIDGVAIMLVSAYPWRAAGTRQHDAADYSKILLIQSNNLTCM